MVLLVLLEALELVLQVTDLGFVAGGTGLLDVDAILLDVFVDGFHARTGWHQPEIYETTLRIPRRRPGLCPSLLIL
jgi:hypothetical protein